MLRSNKFSLFLNISVVILYFLIFVILTFPLVMNFNRAFLGSFEGYRDLPLDIWLHWFVSSSIKAGKSFFYTTFTNYPIGFSLIDNVSGFLIPAFTTIPSIFSNLPASYNFTICFFIIFSAFSGYLLARYLIKDRMASFLAGFIFGFNPFVLNEVSYGRLSAAFGGWIALFVLFLFKILSETKKMNIFIALLMLILTSMTTIYYGMFLAIFTGIFLLYYGLEYKPFKINWSLIKKISLIFIFFILFTCIFYKKSRLLSISQHLFYLKYLGSFLQIKNFPDLKAVYLQSLSLDFPFRGRYIFPEVIKKVSILTMLISIVPILYLKIKPRFWIISAIFFYIMALGPFLKLYGNLVSVKNILVPMPYLIFYCFFPFFSRIHWPDRFLILFMLSVSVLSAYGFKWLIDRFKLNYFYKFFLLLIIIFFLVIEIATVPLAHIFPADLTGAEIPLFYQQLSHEKGDFAIIQFPLKNTKTLYYQTIHHKSIFDGQSNLTLRYSDDYNNFVEQNPFLKTLKKIQDSSDSPISDIKKEELEKLKSIGFKYIVVDSRNREKTARLIKSLITLLGIYREYPDGIMVFKL